MPNKIRLIEFHGSAPTQSKLECLNISSFFLCLGQSVIINSLHCLWVWGCFFLSLSVRSTSQPSLSSLSTLNNESTFKYYCQQIHIFSSHYRTFSLQINVKYLYRICLKLIRCETLLRNCVSIDHRWIQYHHHL